MTLDRALYRASSVVQATANATRELAPASRANWARSRFAAKFAPVTAISRRERMGWFNQ
jgi:hypothetical protein